MGGVTSTQYTTDSKETLEKYYQGCTTISWRRIQTIWEKMLAFRTELSDFWILNLVINIQF
jgi:uncharacterized protein with NRDE domain